MTIIFDGRGAVHDAHPNLGFDLGRRGSPLLVDTRCLDDGQHRFLVTRPCPRLLHAGRHHFERKTRENRINDDREHVARLDIVGVILRAPRAGTPSLPVGLDDAAPEPEPDGSRGIIRHDGAIRIEDLARRRARTKHAVRLQLRIVGLIRQEPTALYAARRMHSPGARLVADDGHLRPRERSELLLGGSIPETRIEIDPDGAKALCIDRVLHPDRGKPRIGAAHGRVGPAAVIRGAAVPR
jgi:hypothetical protein